ncbi:MAG: hypothetical protein EHM35_00715 [Planctomycetaceae bacterium]|nr:MAG: hypothetical protein EHM35_00715 [Planctomycetaceae bacterium]
METNVTINTEQRLFVIPCDGGGCTFLGFDVVFERGRKLAAELGRSWGCTERIGTLQQYRDYRGLVDLARERNRATGWRSTSELTEQLIGLEGRRVEVVDKYGETRRFWVGKSTGFIPCHLEIANRRSTGGPAVTGAPFRSVRVVRSDRR